uniref:TAF2 n=1 Tax=Arundo donax TaxID=35708 RepID=A0A0A9GMU9_ARUDO
MVQRDNLHNSCMRCGKMRLCSQALTKQGINICVKHLCHSCQGELQVDQQPRISTVH